MIARRLYEDPKTVREGSRYWAWIEQYVGQEYMDAMMRGSDLIEEHAGKQSVSRVEELARIFIHATNVCPAVRRPCCLCLPKLICRRWKGDSGTWACKTGKLFREECEDVQHKKSKSHTRYRNETQRWRCSPWWRLARDDKAENAGRLLAWCQGQEICASAMGEAKAPTFSVAFSPSPSTH